MCFMHGLRRTKYWISVCNQQEGSVALLCYLPLSIVTRKKITRILLSLWQTNGGSVILQKFVFFAKEDAILTDMSIHIHLIYIHCLDKHSLEQICFSTLTGNTRSNVQPLSTFTPINDIYKQLTESKQKPPQLQRASLANKWLLKDNPMWMPTKSHVGFDSYELCRQVTDLQ